MSRRALRQKLTRYWLAFAIVTGLAAMGAAAVIAYTVEDRVIDQRLQETASGVRAGTDDPGALPSGFVLYREPTVPIDIGMQFATARSGDIHEF